MTNQNNQVGWKEKFLEKWDIPKEQGGFINEFDAERYANSGQEYEAIIDFIEQTIHQELKKAVREKDKYIDAHIEFVTNVMDGEKPENAYRILNKKLEILQPTNNTKEE